MKQKQQPLRKLFIRATQEEITYDEYAESAYNEIDVLANGNQAEVLMDLIESFIHLSGVEIRQKVLDKIISFSNRQRIDRIYYVLCDSLTKIYKYLSEKERDEIDKVLETLANSSANN